MPNDVGPLFNAARLVRENAHAPYSKFKVGAAVRAGNGQIFTGCNVENAAYPSGTCAEEVAIGAMVSSGERVITDIVIIGDGPSLITPCGACRQRIREFATAQTRIHCANVDGIQRSFLIDELLPYSFGPDILNL